MTNKIVEKFMCCLLFVVLFTTAIYSQSVLPIGSSLPLSDKGMEEVSGRSLSLNDIAEENGLVVIFLSNTCPWVLRLQDRLNALADFADQNDIGLVALNPNEGYRDRGDNLEEMIKHTEKAEYDFPYLLDEDHLIADAFGATRTPEIFLFDQNLELVYTGAFDDNALNANGVKDSHLQIAIEALISGSEVLSSQTNPVGCSIKRTS
jgi:thiol-disulfide isomerase/thioredoxin